MTLRHLLFGKPLKSEEDEGQKVGPLAGVPILGLDGLASAAYGPEALLTVLLPLGLAGLPYVTGLTAVTLALLVLLYVSYRQTIDVYPSGGGAYTVAKENIGRRASLLAASSLALDYILNVAVAISAGVGALVSIAPKLIPHTLALCLALLLLLALINLRGVRASGLLFMLPTYVFILCLMTVIGIGVFRTIISGGQPIPVRPPPTREATLGTASLWLLCRAFASGCTAMTGVEAVSNGVPIFREPRSKHAKRTLGSIIAILLVLLAGIVGLCRVYGVTATEPASSGYRSVLSILTECVVGRGAFYHLTLSASLVVLALSANTSFAGFPRLCRMLAADKFLPEPLMHRGRRLTFSYGIFALTGLSGVLLVIFGGVTDALIPLFAIGALSAFTASQAGMVMHWWRHGFATRSLVLNAAGALATGITAGIVLVSKFTEGAWITVVLIGGMYLGFSQIRAHYDFLAHATAGQSLLDIRPAARPLVVLPIRRWDAVAVKALNFAFGVSPDIIVAQVITEEGDVEDLSPRWDELVDRPARVLGLVPPKLVVLHSAYRELLEPLLAYLKQLALADPDRPLVVVIPELVERRWYQYFLHGQTASLLKALLLLRGMPQLVIVSTPWYLKDWVPERERLFGRRLRARLLT
ncbi:MAG TPA: APC family permease [Polyangiaceae bacterium]|nr:APC family permease [Polyangiaceae bacterium]